MKLDGSFLDINGFYALIRAEKIDVPAGDMKKVAECRKFVEKMIKEKRRMYGVNTGFGELAKVSIRPRDLKKLQENIILSHSSGAGDRAERDICRGALILKVKTFLKGNSGVRPVLVENMLKMLNAGLVPVSYEMGSLGASGDLVPLAHLFSVLYGKGEFYYKGKHIPAQKGLLIAGIKDPLLDSKEGLALTNGMQFTASIGGLYLYKFMKALMLYTDAFSVICELLNVNEGQFSEEVHYLRPFSGIKTANDAIRKNLRGRTIFKDKLRTQDPYTIRCVPQILGGVYDNLNYVRSMIETEFNSVSDNPLFIPEKNIYLSAGNFHGEPLAIALDSAAVSVSVATSLLERQVNRLIHPCLSELPPFGTKSPGLNSGLMIVQYAMASLANRNAQLAAPSSVYSIPVSADQEDFVSMAGNTALKFRDSVKNYIESLSLFYLAVSQVSSLSEKKYAPKQKRTLEGISKVFKPFKDDIYIKDAQKRIHEYLLKKIEDGAE